MNIVKHRNIFFGISLLVIIPGLISLFLFGLNPSIDFVGGSHITLLFPSNVSDQTVYTVKTVLTSQKIHLASVQYATNRIILRTQQLNQNQNSNLIKKLQAEIGPFKEEELSTVGPIVGSETTLNAIYAVILASVLIVIYIAWSFRQVPKPASSWHFGICAIVALLHDAIVVIGIFSLLGHFFNVEVDSLFVTAVLTVIGFSVHDTIVVFDRIRENLRRNSNEKFATVVNNAMLQTMARSLNTSFTVMLVLLTMLLFGGESTTWFIVALLIGVISGTYSSIFNASLLLVVWNEYNQNHEEKKLLRS